MTDDKNLGRKAKTEHGILPGDLPTEKMLERFVRVDHAGEYGAVRLVVDDVDMARQVFHKAQVAHTTIDVFVIELRNRAGSLADIAGRLSEEKINIEYFYSAVAPGVERALGVFKVSDPWRADEITNMMEAND